MAYSVFVPLSRTEKGEIKGARVPLLLPSGGGTVSPEERRRTGEGVSGQKLSPSPCPREKTGTAKGENIEPRVPLLLPSGGGTVSPEELRRTGEGVDGQRLSLPLF